MTVEFAALRKIIIQFPLKPREDGTERMEDLEEGERSYGMPSSGHDMAIAITNSQQR